MGIQDINQESSATDKRRLMKRLLYEINAFEELLDSGLVESGIRRIGAEQEMFLVDKSGRPASISVEILEKLKDPHFTTELARFNLEFNLDPLVLEGRCFHEMEREINRLLKKVSGAAEGLSANVVLAGILPTIRKSDLVRENITPLERYYAMDAATAELRGKGEYELRMTGLDELILKHDSVMLEACNNSFQVHLQVTPEEFAPYYNIAQAITGPVLGVAANSPILLGRRLWHESRVGLFQQSVDTRSVGSHIRHRPGRVHFGDRWVEHSILEMFHESVARFRVMIGAEFEDENPYEKIRQGIPPLFRALQLHNGTVYRWNRPCYGITDGKPHLRIENRVLPSGPTAVDEVANTAFFIGLVQGMASEYTDISKVMEFDNARVNFIDAARQGMGSHMRWLKGKVIPLQELVLKELLPLAREGLQQFEVASTDIERYLGIIEERCLAGTTGASWLLESVLSMQKQVPPDPLYRTLTHAMLQRQAEGHPVHKWSIAKMEENKSWRQGSQHVEDLMSTDFRTVHPEEVVDLTGKMMDWYHLRDVPVENEEGLLVGMISHRQVLTRLLERADEAQPTLLPVRELMDSSPESLLASCSTFEAAAKMLSGHRNLPVVEDGQLIGIFSDYGTSYTMGKVLEEHCLGSAEMDKTQVSEWNVEQFMKKEPPRISAREKIRTAMLRMSVQSHLYILVEDETEKLSGIISHRALLRHSESLEGKPVSLIEEIMTPEPITVSPKMPVLDAIALMHEKRIGCLPVLENATIVGMLTEYDLMQIANYCFTPGRKAKK